jgi:hypothetical protein
MPKSKIITAETLKMIDRCPFKGEPKKITDKNIAKGNKKKWRTKWLFISSQKKKYADTKYIDIRL